MEGFDEPNGHGAVLVGQAAGHRLQRREAEALVVRQEEERQRLSMVSEGLYQSGVSEALQPAVPTSHLWHARQAANRAGGA